MTKRRAFVVDDNRHAAESLARMLTMMDIEPIVCLGPREAIQRLNQSMPDLIILDVNMPGVSGLDVVRFIRRDPRIEQLPIIIVSSETQTSEMKRALQVGANIYLPKPVSFDHLEVALKDAFGDLE